MNALIDPLPRVVYDTVLKCPDIDVVLHTLQERQKARNLVKAGHVPQYISIPPQIKTVRIDVTKIRRFKIFPLGALDVADRLIANNNVEENCI